MGADKRTPHSHMVEPGFTRHDKGEPCMTYAGQGQEVNIRKTNFQRLSRRAEMVALEMGNDQIYTTNKCHNQDTQKEK